MWVEDLIEELPKVLDFIKLEQQVLAKETLTSPLRNSYFLIC